MLLLEHPPTYTAGRRMAYSADEAERLKKLGAEYYSVKRGGQVTFHGPGQLVGYPILDLRDFNLGVRSYIDNLQESLKLACNRLGVNASLNECTGVWVDDRKIAALGVHVQRHLTTHGFALNCTTDLSWFDNIVSCGINKPATSIAHEMCNLKPDFGIDSVTPVLLKSISSVFNIETCPLDDVSRPFDATIQSFLDRDS